MLKLYAAIKKDLRLLMRDKAALAVMFGMPVLLVVIITSIQNSTFKLVNDNKVSLLICNKDGAKNSIQLTDALSKIGMFQIATVDSSLSNAALIQSMHANEALVAIVIPPDFSKQIAIKSASVAAKALGELGMAVESKDTLNTGTAAGQNLQMYYNPVLQETFRLSVKGALRSAQQFTENRQVVEALYASLSNKSLPQDLQNLLTNNQTLIEEIPAAKDGSKTIPNVTQHNVPAWTLFAMFFIVVSLSTNIVKEKLSGSFIRLKTLPTGYFMILIAKQVTYIIVTLLQVLVIFSIGIFLFPLIGLPSLVLPQSMFALMLVSVLCGWCAVSYGQLLGVYAKTMEMAIGFGAVSVVILAAVGGIIVPAFAMPESMKYVMLLSPMHWCLEAYQTLFLGGGSCKEALSTLLPLIIIIVLMQSIAVIGLRKQNLL
jgi:ABC-2 type transport system permease protein